MESPIYIRLRHRVQVKPNHFVRLKDVALVFAPFDKTMELEKLKIYQVKKEDHNIIIIDAMQILKEIISSTGMTDIQFIGPSQTIVEVVERKVMVKTPVFLLVWLLLFAGSAFSIINFHEDVSMQSVHQKVVYLLTGSEDTSPLVFQIPYSIGLGLGMILFFNHVFKKRINDEPSPLEVEMFNYQQAIDHYVIMHENKEVIKHLNDD